jgi:hypothetical protein
MKVRDGARGATPSSESTMIYDNANAPAAALVLT